MGSWWSVSTFLDALTVLAGWRIVMTSSSRCSCAKSFLLHSYSSFDLYLIYCSPCRYSCLLWGHVSHLKLSWTIPEGMWVTQSKLTKVVVTTIRKSGCEPCKWTSNSWVFMLLSSGCLSNAVGKMSFRVDRGGIVWVDLANVGKARQSLSKAEVDERCRSWYSNWGIHNK